MLITDPVRLRNYHNGRRLWQGIPGIAVTKKGKTYITFYSGNTRETFGNYVLVYRSHDGRAFGDPILVVEHGSGGRTFDPVLWLDPLGRLWLCYNTMPEEVVYGVICDDPDAPTPVWGEPFVIGRGIMMNKPTVLSSGEWLFPIAVWQSMFRDDYHKDSMDKPEGSYVYRTVDRGRSFQCLGYSSVRYRHFDEHMVLELPDGVLKMFVRTHYGIGASYSYDGGVHWRGSENTRLGGPSSRFYIGRLRSGRILLINHVQTTSRNNLMALLSDDDGKTFPHKLMLDERDNVSYPDAQQTDDGYIHIIYDRERGGYRSCVEEAYRDAREILTACITEEDILAGRLVSGGHLKRVVNKLTRLDPDVPDPFAVTEAERDALADALLKKAEDPLPMLFARYAVSWKNTDPTANERLDARIDRLLATQPMNRQLLLEVMEQLGQMPRSPGISHRQARELAHQLQGCLFEASPEAALSRQLQCSRYCLDYRFRALTGISLAQFVAQCRRTEAQRQLLAGVSPHQAATACGYADLQALEQELAQCLHCTPDAFCTADQ